MNKEIKFCDLAKQHERLSRLIDDRVKKVFAHTQFINGPEIKELEETLSGFLGVRHAIGVSSGTDALLLSLLAIDIKPGDFVITTPFTFVATAEVISLLNAVPLFADIEEDTFNISPIQIRKALDDLYHPYMKGKISRDKVKAIISVDLFGQCADHDEINAIAEEHCLSAIQDGAQSFGAEYKNKKGPVFCRLNCTSFFPAKPLGCYGDAGAVFTDDDDLALKLQFLRNHGQSQRYNHTLIGLNARLDTLQAAILLAKFDNFISQEITLRNKLAQEYCILLGNLEKEGKIILPKIRHYNKSTWAQFSMRILGSKRTEFQRFLQDKNIPTAIHYPRPLHLQDAFRNLGYKKGDFPVAEKACDEIISLPLHPYMERDEIEYISDAIKEFFKKTK